MRYRLVVILLFAVCFIGKGQQTASLSFKDSSMSVSQFINWEFGKISREQMQKTSVSLMATICEITLCSMKFTVTPRGKVENILASVGVPTSLVEPLQQAIKKTEGHWTNRRRRSIDCILPIFIFPSPACPDDKDAPFPMLQSGAQLLKYEGEFTKFGASLYYKYSVDMAEGVILSPCWL
ncbi:hypothetical protein WBJ53_04895 [Spirosoma sp. SC4-14]|uniref:hypothetical protein n=1 Tax=Spirosoma sp. SC4-14 TaxID=3128900 RepID=UPI0030CF30ED